MRAQEFVTEKKNRRKRKVKGSAYGPGPYGWYGYDSGYSGDGGSDSGGVAESLDYAPKMHDLVDLPIFPSGTSKVVNTGDRIMVVFDIKGTYVPYYISTGHGGKLSVPTGKWYPVFGVAKSGWLNKGGEVAINKFYDSKRLALNAARLNNALGDLTTVEKEVPMMGKGAMAIINRNMRPMDHGEVVANPQEFMLRVNEILVKLGDQPFYKTSNESMKGVSEDLSDDVGNIYALHPDEDEGESVAIQITDVDLDEFNNLWTALPMDYLNQFGGDLPLWDSEDLALYPNIKVKAMTFDQYIDLVGNYIRSDDMANTALSKMKKGVAEAWSEKYKKSINCSRPRGFSQRAHCQGRKKK